MMGSGSLLFYGAGEHAELIYKRVKELITPREPVAFIDGDLYKQGRTLCGLTIYSYSDAVAKYGDDFDIYVTGNEKNAPDIIGFLLENGVEEKRILNYEPVKNRVGCYSLESRMDLFYLDQKLKFWFCCCGASLGTFMERPEVVIQNNKLNSQMFNCVIDKKLAIADEIARLSPPPVCASCYWIQQSKYHFVNKKIRTINIGGNISCNFNCYHCANKFQLEKTSDDVWEHLPTHLKLIFNEKNISEICTVVFALGEPSIGKNLDKVLNMLSKYPLVILSNAYVYSKPIEDALIRGITWLRVSVDSGTPETFKRIKGVDGFNQVSENLERYAKFGTVILKYIIFRGQNDNESDIQGFIKLCDKIGAKAELLNDFGDESELSEEMIELAYLFVNHFNENDKLYGVGIKPSEKKCLVELLVCRGKSIPFCLL